MAGLRILPAVWDVVQDHAYVFHMGIYETDHSHPAMIQNLNGFGITNGSFSKGGVSLRTTHGHVGAVSTPFFCACIRTGLKTRSRQREFSLPSCYNPPL